MKQHYILAAVFGLVLAATPAHAHFTVSTGLTNQDDENVVFNQAGLVSSGFNYVTGRTNQTNRIVRFDGNEQLLTPAAGAARIAATDGSFDYLRINMVDPLVFFDAIEFNIFADSNTTVTITPYLTYSSLTDASITCTGGQATLAGGCTYNISQNGQNQFNIVATNGQLIDAVEIDAPGGITGLAFDDIRQIRLGGVQVVPEPGFYGLLALGVSGLLVVRRRNQRLPLRQQF